MIFELMTKATLLLLFAALATLLLRRRAAATRHLIGIGALAAVLGLPLALLALPAWELPLPVAAEEATEPAPVRRAPSRERPSFDSQALAALHAPERAEGASEIESAPTIAASTAADEPRFGAGTLLAAVWGGGLLFVLARLLLGQRRVNELALDARPLDNPRARTILEQALERLEIARAPRVLVSDALRVPVLWGALSPTLLLPTDALDWSPSRLRMTLLHELAHLRRRDGLSLLIGSLATAIWWFHPLAWYVARNARRDCELATDDLVLASGERPSDYATELLAIARALPRPAAPAALSILGRGQLEHRVHAILDRRAVRGLRPRFAGALAMLLATSALSLAAAQPVAESPEQGPVQALRRAPAEATILPAHDGDEPHDADYRRNERLYDEAMDLHREERWDAAIEGFLDSARAGHRVGASYYNAACGHARLGEADAAIDLMRRSIGAGFDLGEYLLEDSDLDPIRGSAAFQRFVEEMREAGERMPRRGRYDAVVDRYEDLRASGSDDRDDWNEVGVALLSLRDLDRATDALERAANASPDASATPLYNLACAHALDGSQGAALDYLERAVLAGFDSDERFENDSDLASLRGTQRFDEIRELHDTLSLDRFGQHGSWNWHRNSQYSARRWEPAVEEFTRFTAANPSVGRGWSNLGWALHHSRRHGEAREAFARQLDLDYRASIAMYNIACTHAMEGDVDSGIDWLERAVDADAVSWHHVREDDDLDNLRGDARFERLLDELRARHDDMHGKRRVLDRIKRRVEEVL